MKIGELAKAAGVSKDTVRHYVNVGLLQPGRDATNGYLHFSDTHLGRLQFIKSARELGLHLNDIQLIFDDAENAHSPCPRVRDLIVERLTECRAKIRELQRSCARMEEAVAQWQHMPNSVPNGRSVCRLIESQMLTQKVPEADTPKPTP